MAIMQELDLNRLGRYSPEANSLRQNKACLLCQTISTRICCQKEDSCVNHVIGF